MNVFVPEGSRARASSRTRLSSSSMICAGRIALNSEKSSAFDDPRFPRPAMNSRIRWRNRRPVRLARPFPRTASTVRETIVENASSTPWPVRALVRNIGAAGNSFRSQAVSSGPIAIESARSILLNAMPTGTGPAIFVMTSIQSLIRWRVSGRSTSQTARTPWVPKKKGSAKTWRTECSPMRSKGDVGEGDVLAFQADLEVRRIDAAAERAGVRLCEVVLQVPLQEARLADPSLADEDDLELHLADAHGREQASAMG